jgi:Bacterial conjugation TrbI-like protein
MLLTAFALAQNPPAEAEHQAPAVAAESPAQGPTQFAANTVIVAELSKSLDAKKAKTGDPVEAKTTMDVLSQGKILMPRNTRIVGHVTSAKAHSKESPDSRIGIVFDRAIMKDGRELSLTPSVQAIGAPINQNASSTSERATPGGAYDVAGQQIGDVQGHMDGGPRTESTATENPTRYSHSSAAALGPNSQGVIGLKGLELKNPGQSSVVSCGNKNVHLDGGTQLILRVQ